MIAPLPVVLPLLALLQAEVVSPLPEPPKEATRRAQVLRAEPLPPPPAPGSAEGTDNSTYFVSPVQGNPRGLADDGTYLYLTYFNPAHINRVYKVDRTTHQLVSTIFHGLGYLGSLAYDCSDGTFWAGSYDPDYRVGVYHLNANWGLLESFEAWDADVNLGGIDGLTVAGNDLLIGGDMAKQVHRYAKDGTLLGPEVNYEPYRRSGLAHDGTKLWAMFTDWGFAAIYPPQGPPWSGFYTGYYWNYKLEFASNPASGFIEDLEFPCGDTNHLWAHAIRLDTNQSVVLQYDVNVAQQRAGSDCDAWLAHEFPPHGCGSPQPAALQPTAPPPGAAVPLRADRSAGIPSASTSSVDQCLVTCPAGDIAFQVVVRAADNNPQPGSTVTLHFEACPSFNVCVEGGPYTVNQAARTVSTITGPTGVAVFPLRMGGICGSVLVTADGVPLGVRSMASTDQNGDLVVSPQDLAVLFSKSAGDLTGDLDCDGVMSCPVTGVAVDPLPTRFNFGAIWPNPVRASAAATLDVEVPSSGHLNLELFDLAGRRLFGETRSMAAGRQRLQWRIPDGIGPGMYTVRVSDAQEGEGRKKIIVLGP